MTPTAADIIRVTERLGRDYREAIAMPLEAVNAIEAKYGRARMLDHALARKTRRFDSLRPSWWNL